MSESPEPNPTLWREHHVLWTAFAIGAAAALLFMILGTVAAAQMNDRLMQRLHDPATDFQRQLVANVIAFLPGPGILGVAMAAAALRNARYGRLLYFAGLITLLIVLGGPYGLPLAAFILWLGTLMRQACWRRTWSQIIASSLIFTIIALSLFAYFIADKSGGYKDKIALAAGFSVFVTDLFIIGLIAHLRRECALEPIAPGFRISLSTFMAIFLTAATYATILVSVFRR